jgi:hypothetical protein
MSTSNYKIQIEDAIREEWQQEEKKKANGISGTKKCRNQLKSSQKSTC